MSEQQESIPPLKRIYVRKDNYEKLMTLKKYYKIPSMDVLIRIAVHSFKVLMCMEALEGIKYETQLEEERAKQVMEKYPECDFLDLGILKKAEAKKGRETVVVYKVEKRLSDLQTPLHIFKKYARTRFLRREIRMALKELLS